MRLIWHAIEEGWLHAGPYHVYDAGNGDSTWNADYRTPGTVLRLATLVTQGEAEAICEHHHANGGRR